MQGHCRCLPRWVKRTGYRDNWQEAWALLQAHRGTKRPHGTEPPHRDTSSTGCPARDQGTVSHWDPSPIECPAATRACLVIPCQHVQTAGYAPAEHGCPGAEPDHGTAVPSARADLWVDPGNISQWVPRYPVSVVPRSTAEPQGPKVTAATITATRARITHGIPTG